mgnify:CR=1 FL=1
MNPPADELQAPTSRTALTASELRFRRLFEAAHDGILIMDPATRQIIDVNPFLVKFLGYAHAEFIGKELFEIGLLRDEAESKEAFCQLLETGQIRYDDLPLQTKDGRRVDVEFVSNLYQEGDQQVIQCNIRDIAARKRAEKDAALTTARRTAELEDAVQRRTAELRSSNRQLESYVYSIAHDLRAPLRAMQGYAQLLVQECAASLPSAGHGYANAINKSAQVMDRLLVDLLAFSRLNQQTIELGPVALASVVDDALTACAGEIRESRTRVVNLAPWPVVLAHAATLQQVLVNLISNAMKFVQGRPPEVRLRAETRPGGMIRVWVEDNGIGIAPEFHERIFQVFQRLHTTAYPGTGIGLAIVQSGIERLGGKTGLESIPGQGSKFWIELAPAPRPAGPPNQGRNAG